MKIMDYLKKIPQKELSKIAEQHHIYYNRQFSRLWITNQIREKLSDQNYIKELIQKELSTEANDTLKNLISTESINIDSLDSSIYNQLKNLGLIYERNNFCYLPDDLKKILKSNFNLKKKRITTPLQQPQIDFTPNIITTNEVKISFFIYLILSLGYINQQRNKYELNYNKLKQKLLNYIQQINLTDLSNQTLLNYILEYSYQNELLSPANLKLRDDFINWLDSPYEQKVIQALQTFLKEDIEKLRLIIAVLIHYPIGEKIPTNVLYKDLKLTSFNQTKKQLLNLLGLFQINKNHISLTPFCWKLFNPKADLKFTEPDIKDEEIIVDPKINLSTLWNIYQKASLVRIDNKLKFQK